MPVMSNMIGKGINKLREPKMIPYPVPVAKPIPFPVTRIVTVEVTQSINHMVSIHSQVSMLNYETNFHY